MLLRYLLHRLVNREDANRGALRATSAAGMYWPVQRRALRRRSLPARPARRLRAQRRPIWSASQRCCFKHRALRTLLGRKFLRTRTASAGAARPFSWLATIESYCLLTFHRAPLAAAPQTAAAALISACETAHVPATLLRRIPLRTKCVAVAVAGTWQLGRSPWQWLSRGWAAQPIPQQHSNTADAAGNGPKAAAGSGIPTQCATNSCPCSADASAARAGAGRRANPHICALPCCSQILIRRSLHAGTRGSYRCTARLVRG